MKTIRKPIAGEPHDNEVRRVSDERAAELVEKEGWMYCPKTWWRNAAKINGKYYAYD